MFLRVWEAISKNGLGLLVRLEGPFTVSHYCEIIRHLIPHALDGSMNNGCYLFPHDPAPVHKARVVSALLEELAMRASLSGLLEAPA